MKFRKRLFTVLALLTVLLGIVWASAGLNETNKTPVQSEAEEVGRTIGQGIGVSVIFCITAPTALLFALLAWRNSVGLRNELRHREHMETLRSQQAGK